MTDSVQTQQPSQTHPARIKNNTLKNTLECVLVLAVISIVCVALLAVANRFLQVKIELDGATASLINGIAPTGLSDDDALSKGNLKMVDLADGGYMITSLDDYNSKYGTANKKVRALYTSKNTAGKITRVVESEAKGNDSSVVVLVAYDDDNKVSGIVVKSQGESYWDRLDTEKIYKAFIGTSGKVAGSDIATSTGATNSLNAIAEAVSLANDFAVKLGSETALAAPYIVTDITVLTNIKKLSDETVFTCYPVDSASVSNVYVGNNGDTVVEASGGSGYGKVTLLVKVTSDFKVDKLTLTANNFESNDEHYSAPLLSDDNLNAIFGGKSLSDIKGMTGNLLGDFSVTGVTQSSNGLRDTLAAALEFAPTFDKSQYKGAGV